MSVKKIGGQWRLFADAEQMAHSLVAYILQRQKVAIQRNGEFRILLAGGGTPLRAYRLLSQHAVDWSRWRIYLGDERCLPPQDTERNSQAIHKAWLGPSRVPAENVFLIPAELGPERAAQAYAAVIEAAMPFDLVLLGMGEDGHTASLFSGHKEPPGAWVMPVHQAPKPPADRVSLTSAALSQGRQVLILVSGESKQLAVRRWQAGEDLPVSRVSAREHLHVWLDRQAAGELVSELCSKILR